MSWLNTFLKRKSPLTEPSTEDKSVELREGSAEFDEFAARAELDKGQNLAHGASHLANLLNFDPGNREWMALFDQYVDKTNGDLEKLIPRGDKLFAATAKVMADPQLRAKLASNGSEVSTSASPAEFGKWAAADGKSAVTRIEQAGVKLD